MGSPGACSHSAVGDLIADRRQQRRRKIAGQFGRRDAVAAEFIARFQNVRVGDFLGADGNLDRRRHSRARDA